MRDPTAWCGKGGGGGGVEMTKPKFATSMNEKWAEKRFAFSRWKGGGGEEQKVKGGPVGKNVFPDAPVPPRDHCH